MVADDGRRTYIMMMTTRNPLSLSTLKAEFSTTTTTEDAARIVYSEPPDIWGQLQFNYYFCFQERAFLSSTSTIDVFTVAKFE